MTTLKLGSKGEAVKTLQAFLKITADGIFGPGTEKAVKDWQKSHGLIPDGIVGKNIDWIRCYAEGKYTYVQEGRSVWHEYDDNLMSGETILDNSVPIQIGLDFGLTPAAVIGQRLPSGRWQVIDEIVTFDMGLERYGHQLIAEILQEDLVHRMYM